MNQWKQNLQLYFTVQHWGIDSNDSCWTFLFNSPTNDLVSKFLMRFLLLTLAAVLSKLLCLCFLFVFPILVLLSVFSDLQSESYLSPFSFLFIKAMQLCWFLSQNPCSLSQMFLFLTRHHHVDSSFSTAKGCLLWIEKLREHNDYSIDLYFLWLKVVNFFFTLYLSLGIISSKKPPISTSLVIYLSVTPLAIAIPLQPLIYFLPPLQCKSSFSLYYINHDFFHSSWK